MEASQISEKIIIKSKLKDYSVEFIDNLSNHLKSYDENEVIFIIDQNILNNHKKIKPIIDNYKNIVIKSGEENKTIDYAQIIINKLLEYNIRKNTILIAIGGGVTQDLVAFISSIIFRGIDWIFYPTTLLAQADSCIGSKSSINYGNYKNLLGTFIPPNKIFIDNNFLITLKKDDIKSGIGEMIHYFLNDGLDDAKNMMDDYDELLDDTSKILPYIEKSLKIKKIIIEKDEFDLSIRHIFNYGHTFGHAIESVTNYKINHGQAVTLGMDISNFFSYKFGFIEFETFKKLHEILIKNMPTYNFNKSNIDNYIEALSKDKKNVGDKLGCILTYGPGKMEKHFVEMDGRFKSILLQYSKEYSMNV